jgi:DNA-binding SARP family transcriptional activator/predicted negative regulator of RcsB-dependent stress response
MNGGKITYHQQVSYCGKPHCRRCREGIGHGPYWYAYQTVNGRTIRTYVGKHPPAEMKGPIEQAKGSMMAPELAAALARLYVLGQFRLEYRDEQQQWQFVTDTALQHQRVRALLHCLISSPGRKLGREQIMEMLWPDLDFETATHRLDRAVYSLRRLLEPGRSKPATSDLLLTEHSTLVLAGQAQLWIDADAFDAVLSQARATSDPGQTEQLLEEATLLYSGDYLPEERDIPWIQTRREALQRSWIGLLLELADLRIAREALPGAIDTLDRLLAVDPTNEAAVQRLIILLTQSGRRAEALRIYHRFATLLRQEYQISPLPETRALFESAQRGEDPSTPARAGISPGVLQVGSQAPGTQAADSRAHLHVGRSNQSPLVGRGHELAVLHRRLLATEQTRHTSLAGQKIASSLSLDSQRHIQCVILMGDVGIGKTRLAEETGREARRRGWAVAWSRAYAQESNIPYRMWVEVLRKAMAQGLWQRQEIARRPLMYQALEALLPELHDLLPQIELSSPTLREQEQLRLWEAVRALLAAISKNTPLFIVLDDLQWADNSSCELLAYLVRQLRGQSVMIVGTCREIELSANHPLRPVLIDLQREQAAETLAIQRLTDEQIRVLVSHLPEPLVQHIQARAAGNPFFAEELARGVGSSHLAPGEGTKITPADGGLVPMTLPDTISAVLDLRMGRMSSACHRLLVRAAILGGSFEFNTIRFMEAGGPDDGEDTILDLLEEALQAGMLTEEGSGTHITYHFWHPLLVSYLYDGLSAGRRASLHRRAVEVLRQSYQGREAEGAAAIAYHLVNGGADALQIAHYAELAGDRAYVLSAYPEAAQHYRLAFEQRGTLDADASGEEQLHLANLLERLGECTRVQGNDQEARSYFEQALEVHKHYRLATSDLDSQYEAQVEALLWCEVGRTWFDTGEYKDAQQCYFRGKQTLRESGIKTGPAWANLYLHQSYLLWKEGKFEESRRTAHQALHIFEQVLGEQHHTVTNAFHSTATRRTLEGDPVDLGRTHRVLAALAATVGQSAIALEHLNTALAIFEQYDRRLEIAIICVNTGDVYLREGELMLAQATLRRSLSIAERIGDASIMSVTFANLAILAARLGDLPEAEACFKRGITLAEQVNDPVYVSLWQGCQAPILQDQGKTNEAKVSLRRALKISRAMNFTPCIGIALVVLGQLRIAQALAVQENDSGSTRTLQRPATSSYTHLLQKARISLQRALSLEGLEAETRTEGQLALSKVAFLLGEIDEARQQALQVMREAQRYEQTWLLACAQRLMGTILAALSQQDQASKYFEQALETFDQSGMRLEWARSLQSYGTALLAQRSTGESGYTQGLKYLQEASQVFRECNANLDLQVVERLLSSHKSRGMKVTKK